MLPHVPPQEFGVPGGEVGDSVGVDVAVLVAVEVAVDVAVAVAVAVAVDVAPIVNDNEQLFVSAALGLLDGTFGATGCALNW